MNQNPGSKNSSDLQKSAAFGRRVILFTRDPLIRFAIHQGNKLHHDFSDVEIEELKLHTVHHSVFDEAVGRGKDLCMLFECADAIEHPAIAQWLAFRPAVSALADSEDKRFLQLAVQFISNGMALDDSVLAVDADDEMVAHLSEVEKHLN